jgi:thiamine biosynthesis lipoprotein ApbE
MMEIDAWATALSVMGKKHAEAIVAARPEWQMYALFDE